MKVGRGICYFLYICMLQFCSKNFCLRVSAFLIWSYLGRGEGVNKEGHEGIEERGKSA